MTKTRERERERERDMEDVSFEILDEIWMRNLLVSDKKCNTINL
jgi:hypothetical protein